MNVTIKTPFGEMTFDMSTDNAMDLLRRATEYAEFHQPAPAVETLRASTDPLRAEPTTMVMNQYTKPEVDESIARVIAETEEKDTDEPKPEPAPETKAPPRSRVETMFGDRATWGKPAAEQAPEKRDYNAEGFKGFLYIKCGTCGEEKGFCIKVPIRGYQCKCGAHTVLHDLVPVHVKCKCGAEFTYKTNLTVENFTIPCHRCGAPVDMALNKLATAYVTVGSLRR